MLTQNEPEKDKFVTINLNSSSESSKSDTEFENCRHNYSIKFLLLTHFIIFAIGLVVGAGGLSLYNSYIKS